MTPRDFMRRVKLKALSFASRCASVVLGTVTHVMTDEPLLALTFDDGPDPTFTPRLLKLLKAHDARATFFMVGSTAQRYPDIVREVAEEGHAIGNHSWDHPSFPLISGRERRAQIRACQRALHPYGARIFRPPYGDQNISSRFDALLLGYRVVTWSLIAEDWLGDGDQTIADRVLSRVRSGGIVLFHDALHTYVDERYRDREDTLRAVEIIVSRLKGFRFVTVPELINCGRVGKTHWIQRPTPQLLNSLQDSGETTRRYAK